MDTAWLLSSAIKAAILLAASGLGAVLLLRSTAAARHQIWTLGVIAALVVPVLSWVLPSLLSVGTPAISVGPSLYADAIVVTGVTAAGAQTSLPWLAIIWAAGAALVSLRVLRGQLAARRLARTSEPAHAESWLSAQRAAAGALGLVNDVGLRRSEMIESPMTIGILQPRVLLPAAADAWSPERLRTVLVHELGHVGRHDLLVQLAAQLVCALYWWNPLAWLAAARLRIEREHACDDLVLAAGVRPSSYASELLEVSRSIAADAATHACACMADPSRMELRLRRILDGAVPRGPIGAGGRLAARGVMLACAVTVACTSAAANLPEEPGPVSIGAPSIEYGVRAPFQQPGFEQRSATPEEATYLTLVAAEVKRHAEELDRCFARRLRVHPELAGEIVIHWTITADGTVPDKCITRDTVGDPGVADCVTQLVTDGRFPAPSGAGVNVAFPFVFRGARR
jgi:beta-lactamase regulating signal transducer with metallopeptidase domain